MAAVTVIANPLAKANDKVLIFQSGDVNLALRVSSRSLIDFNARASMGPKSTEVVGHKLTVPSQLVSMVYQDTVTVYGITGQEVADLKVEMLSPVQACVGENGLKPITGVLAGCAQPDGERGWLYFITKDDDGNTKIGEWVLSEQGPKMNYLDLADFSPDTNLYAVYDEAQKKRWLILQQSDDTVIIYDPANNKKFDVSESDTRVMSNTPLAVTIIPGNEEKKRECRIVIYFVSVLDKKLKKKRLLSANAVLGGKTITFEEPEEQPRVVKSSDDSETVVKDWAGLSAYLDTPRERVVVFGLTTKEEGREATFQAIQHPWKRLTDSK